MPPPRQKIKSNLPECHGCDLCGHVYDGNQEELFGWRGRRWLCGRCIKKRRSW